MVDNKRDNDDLLLNAGKSRTQTKSSIISGTSQLLLGYGDLSSFGSSCYDAVIMKIVSPEMYGARWRVWPKHVRLTCNICHRTTDLSPKECTPMSLNILQTIQRPYLICVVRFAANCFLMILYRKPIWGQGHSVVIKPDNGEILVLRLVDD